jgi:hypothetical protein
MCKKILFLIFIICSPLFAQDESEKGVDTRKEFQDCISENTVDPVIDKINTLEKLGKKGLN